MENIKRKAANLGVGILATVATVFPKVGHSTEKAPVANKNPKQLESVLKQEIATHSKALAQFESMDKSMDVQISANQHYLEAVISTLDNHDQFANVYAEVKEYITESSKNYDILSPTGYTQFVEAMKKSAFSPEFHKATNPELTKQLNLLADGMEHAKWGLKDQEIRDKKRRVEIQWLEAIAQDLTIEKAADIEEGVVALNKQKLDNMEDSEPLIASSQDAE